MAKKCKTPDPIVIDDPRQLEELERAELCSRGVGGLSLPFEKDWNASGDLGCVRRKGQDCRGGRRVIRKLILEDAWAI